MRENMQPCNKIPETSPDMIYLDGPSTFATKIII